MKRQTTLDFGNKTKTKRPRLRSKSNRKQEPGREAAPESAGDDDQGASQVKLPSLSPKQLFLLDDHSIWKQFLEQYEDALEKVIAKKKKPALKELDRFWRVSLGKRFEDKKSFQFSKADLEKVMQWKITRGKFRPLMRLIRMNPEELIETQVSSMLKLSRSEQNLTTREGKTKILKELMLWKGVGVATASAILAALFPASFPFMSDEAMEGANLERKYTLPVYLELTEKLVEKASSITTAQDASSPVPLNAEELGRALWVCSILQKS